MWIVACAKFSNWSILAWWLVAVQTIIILEINIKSHKFLSKNQIIQLNWGWRGDQRMRNWVTIFYKIYGARWGKIRNLICLHFQRGFRTKSHKRPLYINVLFNRFILSIMYIYLYIFIFGRLAQTILYSSNMWKA